jgi:endonuclease/exonuclease/phosphatase (EEP) superfamily protein YafD
MVNHLNLGSPDVNHALMYGEIWVSGFDQRIITQHPQVHGRVVIVLNFKVQDAFYAVDEAMPDQIRLSLFYRL